MRLCVSMYACMHVCVCVCVCQRRYFRSCSNCKVQQPYISYHVCKPSVRCSIALQVSWSRASIYPICTAALAHHGSCPGNPATVHHDTHCMRMWPTAAPQPMPPCSRGGRPGAGESPTGLEQKKNLILAVKVRVWGNVCPARARCATFVLSILALAPRLSSPREVPQVDRTGPQTFPAKHVA